jgi:hypothetical protein
MSGGSMGTQKSGQMPGHGWILSVGQTHFLQRCAARALRCRLPVARGKKTFQNGVFRLGAFNAA